MIFSVIGEDLRSPVEIDFEFDAQRCSFYLRSYFEFNAQRCFLYPRSWPHDWECSRHRTVGFSKVEEHSLASTSALKNLYNASQIIFYK